MSSDRDREAGRSEGPAQPRQNAGPPDVPKLNVAKAVRQVMTAGALFQEKLENPSEPIEEAQESEEQTTLDLIAGAAAVGRDAHRIAYKSVGEAGAAGSAWVSISPDEEHRPLVRELAAAGMGQFDPWTCRCHVRPQDMGIKLQVRSVEVQVYACEWFAGHLRSAGYWPTVAARLD